MERKCARKSVAECAAFLACERLEFLMHIVVCRGSRLGLVELSDDWVDLVMQLLQLRLERLNVLMQLVRIRIAAAVLVVIQPAVGGLEGLGQARAILQQWKQREGG